MLFRSCAEARDLLGHQRVHDVEHQRRQRYRPVHIARAGERQPAVEDVEQAALDDDADIAVARPEPLVELVADKNRCAAGNRRPTLSASWRKVADRWLSRS